MTTRFPRKILFGTIVLLACACTRGVAGGAVQLSPQRIVLSPAEQSVERVMLRTGTIELVVEDIAPAHAQATALAVNLGGRVEREVVTERSATLVMRVPDARLEAALDSLGTLGEITSRSVAVQDVTTTVIDLDARIASLTAARDRLRELQTRAATVTEIVEVERELARIQGELDSLQGRLAYLRDAAALSQLQVTLQRRVILGPLGVVAEKVGWVVEKLFVWRR
ncbi:MAG TPA: DUF4349 domain-containing protein [Gemmatimonadaceae bacterium]|nr:DUF4349 domain-containing protein [Gemmatimonadaceae bacterium]